jgi:hypothetical protein
MPHAPAQKAARQSARVARLVRLHHRRRGWAWVAVGSLIGLAVYAGISVHVLDNRTGTAEALGLIPLLVLLALALAGLVVVIVDTSLIHRADAAVRVSAKGKVTHHPVYAHVHRYPPRHRASWAAAILMLLAMTSLAVFYLPAGVNALGYVVGAEQPDTFHPVSYGQACTIGSRLSHCRVVTEGYLSRSGAHVTWYTQVPLARPFTVRDPIWAWGSGRTLTADVGSAIPTIIGSLFFDGVTLLLVYALVVLVREADVSASVRRKPARR